MTTDQLARTTVISQLGLGLYKVTVLDNDGNKRREGVTDNARAMIRIAQPIGFNVRSHGYTYKEAMIEIRRCAKW